MRPLAELLAEQLGKGNRRERRDRVEVCRAQQRAVATAVRRRFADASRSERQTAVAGVVAYAIGHARPQRVGTEHLRLRCSEQGIDGRWDYSDRPSHGLIDLVLNVGRELGCWSWPKYHRARQVAPGVWRCPARLLQLQGGMRSIALGVALGAAASSAALTAPEPVIGNRSCTSSVSRALDAVPASPAMPSAESPPGVASAEQALATLRGWLDKA